MDQLILALYDTETAVDPTKVGGWDAYDEITFACGVIRWVQFIKPKGRPAMRQQLAQSVYWNPLHMLDDLLRPIHHAIVGWNSLAFDNPVIVHQAMPDDEAAGVPLVANHLSAKEAQEIAAQLAAMRKADRSPIVRVRPTTDAVREIQPAADFMRWAEKQAHYSRIITPGLGAMNHQRADLLGALNRRTFDPLAYYNEICGSDHVCRLDWIREGLNDPMANREAVPAYTLNGEQIDGADVPGMWQSGQRWHVLEKCIHDVNVMAWMLQQAFSAARCLNVHRLNGATTDGQPVPLDQWAAPSGSAYSYKLPTGAWWSHLAAMRDRVR